MKAGFLRTVMASVALLSLVSCGGYTSVNIGGTVSWVTAPGGAVTTGSQNVVLTTNGLTASIANNDGATVSYNFNGQIPINDTFNVTVQTQPKQYTCVVLNPTGSVGGQAITNIATTCSRNTYTISGVVNGLVGTGLLLANGSSNTLAISPSSTNPTPVTPATAVQVSFTLPTAIADGASYGVTVLTQPAGQNCTVSGGVGTMPPADILAITTGTTTTTTPGLSNPPPPLIVTCQ